MKIYFSGSVSGGRQDQEIYRQLIRHLQGYGQVFTEHIGNPKLTAKGDPLNPEVIYIRDLGWLKRADVVVAEITQPSFGVGYEVSKAEEWRKSLCCLYRYQKGKVPSAMVVGNKNIDFRGYRTIDEAVRQIDNFFSSLRREA